MLMEHDNVATLMKAYAAWSGQKAADLSCWIDILDENVRLQSLLDGAPALAFTAPRSGKEEVIAYLEGLTAEWEMISYDVDEYIAQGDRIVALTRVAWKNRKTGKTARTPKIDVWRMKDGRVLDFGEFYDTAQVLAAATP